MATITELTNKYTEIDNAKKAAFAAIIEKGVAVPDGTKLDGMADLIRSIPTGGSSTSIETCEVSITFRAVYSGNFPTYVSYTTISDGKIVNRVLNDYDVTFDEGGHVGQGGTATGTATINCIVGTSVYLADEDMCSYNIMTSDNVTLTGTIGTWGAVQEVVINSGSTATIEPAQ